MYVGKTFIFSLLLLLVSLTGCRIKIDVPVGGSVVTDSGNHSCAAGSACTLEVSDTLFHEVFRAQPDEDHLFSGWKKKPRGFCGGRLTDCELLTTFFAGSDALMAILESDEDYYLEPTFIGVNDVRLYQAGDFVEFSGTLTVSQPLIPLVASDVVVRMEFQDSAYAYEDKNVLAVNVTVTEKETAETAVATTHLWQESNGAFFDLVDEYGNYYMEAATTARGIPLATVPLVPYAQIVFPFYTMYGGHVSGFVTSGDRAITVAESQTISVPLGVFSTYPVTVEDHYSYSASYLDYKRDSSVTKTQTIWMSQAKGLVKKKEVVNKYSPTGKLEKTTTLELEAMRTNF
jgi:hypothetical protein